MSASNTVKLYAPTADPVYIGLTSGHTLVVERAGTEVETRFRRAAIAEGCLTSQDEVIDEAEGGAAARGKLIADAITAMLDSDEEGAFKQDGKPNLTFLSKKVGFNVQREEADTIFEQVTADKG